jgi:hypothetical protein
MEVSVYIEDLQLHYKLKYDLEEGSCAMMHILSFVKICLAIQKLIRGPHVFITAGAKGGIHI